jgi:hypothetical protein
MLLLLRRRRRLLHDVGLKGDDSSTAHAAYCQHVSYTMSKTSATIPYRVADDARFRLRHRDGIFVLNTVRVHRGLSLGL